MILVFIDLFIFFVCVPASIIRYLKELAFPILNCISYISSDNFFRQSLIIHVELRYQVLIPIKLQANQCTM